MSGGSLVNTETDMALSSLVGYRPSLLAFCLAISPDCGLYMLNSVLGFHRLSIVSFSVLTPLPIHLSLSLVFFVLSVTCTDLLWVNPRKGMSRKQEPPFKISSDWIHLPRKHDQGNQKELRRDRPKQQAEAKSTADEWNRSTLLDQVFFLCVYLSSSRGFFCH